MSQSLRESLPLRGRVARQGWLAALPTARVPAAIVVVALASAPLLLSDFRLNLLAKFLTFAIVAIAVDIAWGYGGMLSLGHGLFFGLGAYAMGMHLKLAAGGGALPDFMGWSGVTTLPVWWAPFRSAWFAVPAAVLIPAAIAAGLGWVVFRNRVRGAYFAILTQALVLIFTILVVSQQATTGGTNGLTNLTAVFGRDLTAASTQRGLYLVTAVTLVAVYVLARRLIASRYGRLLVAVRDGEDRTRFLGYDPTKVKVAAFAFSAGLAGLAGALFVPSVGIIAPGLIGVVPSLQMVMWVAIGGRATLWGAALGAVLFGVAQTAFSEALPSGWLYLQGGLLIAVLVAAPLGLAGILRHLGRRRTQAVSP